MERFAAVPLRTGLRLALSTLLLTASAAGAQDEGTSPVVRLDAGSTLQQWKAANAADRSRVSVEIARRRLGDKADRLEVARTAMEITGCVSRTASDARFGGWKVDATAATCLTAQERQAPASAAPPLPPAK